MTTEEPKKPEVKKQTLQRDDFIEWILRNTKEEWEFRIYQTRSHILVGINREGKVEDEE